MTDKTLVVIYDVPYADTPGGFKILWGYSGYFKQIVTLSEFFADAVVFAPRIAPEHSELEVVGESKVRFQPLSEGVHGSKTSFFRYAPHYLTHITRAIENHKHNAFFLAFVPGSMIGLCAAWKLKRAGVPYALRVTSYVGKEFGVRGGVLRNTVAAIVQPCVDFFMRRLLSNTVSFYSGKVLYAGLPGTHLPVISSSFDENIIQLHDPKPIHTPLRLLYVGMIEPRKGVLYLLEALRQLLDEGHDSELRIVGGEIGKPYRHELERRVKELQLEKHVTFVGWVPFGNRLFEHYRWADVFVFPTLYDIQGKVQLEAMAHGVPVVATDVGGIGAIVKHEVTGLLVKPGSAEALCSSLIRIKRDDTLREHLVRSGYGTATHATIERQTRIMLDHLRAIYPDFFSQII
ncbi:MAG: hypothetical protein A3J66_01835 [Candidatus Magasanikbacteria bacterium RIFCSPHIGHO2_02_FULL_47_14]|uniref:Glycosyl transferase family 1 domain-containing protein n=1 Tax=Candidatus Magasanikbacteria bacterium RIFCSPHIGHO2_02_FULL_47_14 TaxID=1798680 RepID=A0A1F6M2W3_9BACT|nr:MAG: hypothetical protein A3J66_01835 [Candidatus Magasanikbacteria bacterium RIFCSPHIGHO2_02_FULL_47_14]